ncbi:MAG TPA: thiamine-phosphate kinase [Opitutaceae bacterium]|jgi:thiamine-monophosphate kinase|nr:thiamine-phosphate kinase [Opitutaceae bacterium]
MSLLAKNKSGSVAALGEEKLIALIRRWLGPVSPPTPFGIGDDCAVLPATSARQLITTDPVIYGRHFDDATPAAAAGAKLLKRNLSDLAAMGAQPTAAVLSLTLDPRVSVRWLEQFYRGLAAAARRWRVRIVGGDLTQAENFVGAYLTLLGSAAGPRIVMRSGARAGDAIYVTGQLGGSLLGHHWRFTPRLAEGAWLARQSAVRAMMDVSDGLAKDLRALTPRGAKPAIDAAVMPVSAAARRLATHTKKSPLHHALCDGEDYELVFALARAADGAAFEKSWLRAFPRTHLTRIGQFVRAGKRPVNAVNLDNYHGYEHLRSF